MAPIVRCITGVYKMCPTSITRCIGSMRWKGLVAYRLARRIVEDREEQRIVRLRLRRNTRLEYCRVRVGAIWQICPGAILLAAVRAAKQRVRVRFRVERNKRNCTATQRRTLGPRGAVQTRPLFAQPDMARSGWSRRLAVVPASEFRHGFTVN